MRKVREGWGDVVGPVVESVFFLGRGSRPTARTSGRVTVSLLSALGTGRAKYMNVTTGVVKTGGEVVTIGVKVFGVTVFGPGVIGHANTCRARRKYLSLSKIQDYEHCRRVRIRCRSVGFGGGGRGCDK